MESVRELEVEPLRELLIAVEDTRNEYLEIEASHKFGCPVDCLLKAKRAYESATEALALSVLQNFHGGELLQPIMQAAKEVRLQISERFPVSASRDEAKSIDKALRSESDARRSNRAFVRARFPNAFVVKQAEGLFVLRGVVGLCTSGIAEHYVWEGAARELGDPVLERARLEAAEPSASSPVT